MHFIIIAIAILVIVFVVKSVSPKRGTEQVKDTPLPASSKPNKTKATTAKPALGKNISPMRELERLNERKEAGDITEAEYTKLKKRITE